MNSWDLFIDKLVQGREYQKEAIKNAIVYLASGRYSKLEDLIDENYDKNSEIRKKYLTKEDYYEDLQIKGKLFANIDLATGTGKSYVRFRYCR